MHDSCSTCVQCLTAYLSAFIHPAGDTVAAKHIQQEEKQHHVTIASFRDIQRAIHHQRRDNWLLLLCWWINDLIIRYGRAYDQDLENGSFFLFYLRMWTCYYCMKPANIISMFFNLLTYFPLIYNCNLTTHARRWGKDPDAADWLIRSRNTFGTRSNIGQTVRGDF